MKFVAIAFVLLLVSAGAEAQPSTDLPEGVVRRLMTFAQHGQQEKLVNDGPATPQMRSLFTKGFVADWEGAMTFNSVEPVFDADIFDGEQGVEGTTLMKAWAVSSTGQTALVIGTLKTVGDDKVARLHDQIYVLLKEGGAWKIDEIVYSSKPDFIASLHSSLRKTIADHAPPAKP